MAKACFSFTMYRQAKLLLKIAHLIANPKSGLNTL